MTVPDPTSTYVYVADAELAVRLRRESTARLRRPLPLGILLVFGVVLGIVASLVTNSASLPTYRGRVLLIGVVWGLVWVMAVVVLTAVIVVPLSGMLIRRRVARDYPLDSVTEVEVGAEALVVRRPTGTQTVPYREIARVRPIGSWLTIARRGRMVADLLPKDLLPYTAVELIRARARGVAPATAGEWDGEPTRQMVVPTGWAGHVAAVHTREGLRHPRFWFRLGLATVTAAAVAVMSSPAWLMAAPVLALVSLAAAYGQARHAIGSVLPSGSIASLEVLDDRLVSRNAGGVREIRYDEILSVVVRDDVVLLRLTSAKGQMLLARELLPDDVLERLRPAP